MELLYSLQILRENTPEFLTTFMLIISHMAYYGGPVVMLIVFLGIDKAFGYDLVFCVTSANLSCSVIKSGMRIERPWFRDERLYVAPAALHSSSGYSFPSGHASMAMACYGSIMYKVKKIWVSILAVFMILLTMFSRLFLGAHTLEDVLFGIGQSFIVTVIAYVIINLVRKNPKYDIAVLIGGLLLSAACAVFIYTRPYTSDFEEIQKMLKDGLGAVGMFSGAIVGWYIEKHFIKFENAKNLRNRITRVIGGLVAFAFYYLYLSKKILSGLEIGLAEFLRFFTVMLLIIDVIPLVIIFVQKSSAINHQINE